MFKYIMSCLIVFSCLFGCKSTATVSTSETKKIEKSTPAEKPVDQVRDVRGYDVK